ncbi:UNVERIFIED_CONTAM: hypothetical protein PYX00_009460 [Menopon gallinae]|uniref:Uncharacterized protein n=1 Tax=Menopon gallinae TaxID=328185 RepID=A0AAW2HBJ7_9NEOP
MPVDEDGYSCYAVYGLAFQKGEDLLTSTVLATGCKKSPVVVEGKSVSSGCCRRRRFFYYKKRSTREVHSGLLMAELTGYPRGMSARKEASNYGALFPWRPLNKKKKKKPKVIWTRINNPAVTAYHH